MRILLTSPSMQAGGAERVVAMLTAGLANRGHEIILAAPRGVRDEDLCDVPHSRLSLTEHGRGPGGAVVSTLGLAQAVRRFSPDLIHAQNVKSAVTARAAALVARAPLRRSPPVLATFHGVLPNEYQRSARLLRRVDHVACVSADLQNNIVAAGLRPQKTSLVRNAVTAASALDHEHRAILDREFALAGAPTVAIVGRLVPQKAHQRFVVAARRIADELPAVRFLIVGDGPRRTEIERLADVAGITGHTRFTGVRADARAIIARAELVVFSSDWEGLSIAALESLAAGTPVVSTDVQGMRELLEGGAGAVVPLDDGTALGKRVIAVLTNESERLAMGRAGQELIARDFSLAKMVDAYERLYEQLVCSR